MRTFVKYGKDGRIVATVRAEALPDRATHPFGKLGTGESAIEVKESGLQDVPLSELHEGYRVEGRQKKLVRHRGRAKAPARRRAGTKR